MGGLPKTQELKLRVVPRVLQRLKQRILRQTLKIMTPI